VKTVKKEFVPEAFNFCKTRHRHMGNAFLKRKRTLLSVIELCSVQHGKVRIIIIIIIGNAA
jgi:hypothetical protein